MRQCQLLFDRLSKRFYCQRQRRCSNRCHCSRNWRRQRKGWTMHCWCRDICHREGSDSGQSQWNKWWNLCGRRRVWYLKHKRQSEMFTTTTVSGSGRRSRRLRRMVEIWLVSLRRHCCGWEVLKKHLWDNKGRWQTCKCNKRGIAQHCKEVVVRLEGRNLLTWASECIQVPHPGLWAFRELKDKRSNRTSQDYQTERS